MITRAIQRRRRRLLQMAGALAAVPFVPARAAAALPEIPALLTYLSGRTPGTGRLTLDLPRLADNGLAVPLRMSVSGPFTPTSYVRSLQLFSEANPVPLMAAFEFPAPVARVESDTRVRLNGTQRVVAIATFSDGALQAAVAEVEVTAAACMDGS